MAQELGRSPTFVVGSESQRGSLDALVRREQHFSENYTKNKPLCFNAKAFQKTHPKKAQIAKAYGRRDADATLCSPMLVAIADGVSQIEEFGIDASELPNELLNCVEELAVQQLLPGQETEEYLGPISLLREAYESTSSLGSTTVLTAVMDNSTKIHGKLHPMIAVCSVGDCEILVLRRTKEGSLLPVFHTEMQRINGNAQSPLQLARVDDSIDPNFTEDTMIEVIERGSAVHCVSAYEGDIVVLGTDGVFDNLFVDEVVAICDEMLCKPVGPRQQFKPVDRSLLGEVAKRIVLKCHSKTEANPDGNYPEAPIGKGGKIDDTSCLVGEVVEWTEEHGAVWSNLRRRRWWQQFFTCGGNLPNNNDEEITVGKDYEYATGSRVRNYPANPNGSFSTVWGSFSEYGGSQASFASAYTRGGGRASFQQPQRPPAQRQRVEEEEEDDEKCSVM
mmetsp:Transcript_50990/g.93212  ORF Transcript_50990/g.93212 Transcript_50990/m.93212 type:complete len:448 (+) Transcript_50990:94-1437(+)